MENKEAASSEPTADNSAPNLLAERDALIAEKSELQNLLLRQRADFENFRRRTEKERMESSEYAAMEAVRAILPVLDDFERALTVPCNDAEYVRGMELIYQRTQDTLKKLGLEPLDAVGEKFDPHLHHAIEMVTTEEAEDQSVLGVFQRGYNFKGRNLRPAMVKVAVR
ncbi:MAG: nucleotide exchange factor GrpE [Acidobacteriia bacterium 12-62-4]|nr:MAG: nucleotide exchange factor GrpE [Acidobacteriia bacterium 12-62-4]